MTRALIVVDVQESFRQRPIYQASSNPEIVDKVNLLVDHARANGDLVVWVLHSEPGSAGPFDPAQGHVRLMDGLIAKDDEPFVTKTSINAFTTTNLQQLLVSRGIRQLTVCGIQTEQCCETTTRLASDLGFDVDFAIDATATFPIQHRTAPAGRPLAEILADPLTLSTADILSRTEYALAGRFATIRTVAELIDA